MAADGSLESGIDGGGLFKEFMMLGRSQLTPGYFMDSTGYLGALVSTFRLLRIYVCRTAFSPEYGLFSANSDNRMYPFPGAFAMHPDAEKLFRFLGKVGVVTAFLGTETHSETPEKRFIVKHP